MRFAPSFPPTSSAHTNHRSPPSSVESSKLSSDHQKLAFHLITSLLITLNQSTLIALTRTSPRVINLLPLSILPHSTPRTSLSLHLLLLQSSRE